MGNAITPPETKHYNILHKAPSLAEFPCDHTVAISFTWKILYKAQKIVNYDWQYKGQTVYRVAQIL